MVKAGLECKYIADATVTVCNVLHTPETGH